MFDFSKMMGSAGDTSESFELDWSEDAKARIRRIPEGFMRNMTISRVESSAKDIASGYVGLEFLEKELMSSASMMESMMGKGGGHPEKVSITPASEEKSSSPDIYYCEICGFTMDVSPDTGCPNCKSTQEKHAKLDEREKTGRVSKTSGQILKWEEDALGKLEEIPSGFMRDLTRWRVERFSRAGGVDRVTGSIFNEKYKEWEQASGNYGLEMPWDEEAVLKVAKIPSFVRGIIQKEVEKAARSKGASSVTSAMLLEIRKKWESGMNFHKK